MSKKLDILQLAENKCLSILPSAQACMSLEYDPGLDFKTCQNVIKQMQECIQKEQSRLMYEKGYYRQPYYKMQFKPAGSEKKFCQYMFRQICEKGGTRMQMVASDLANLMQKNLDAIDDVNLYRKSFGNLEQCLKQVKHPFYILDSMVVKFRKREEIDLLFQQGHIIKEDYQLYIQTYEENQQKMIQTMKINNQNECKNCGSVYNVLANAQGNCPKNEQKHEPKHNF